LNRALLKTTSVFSLVSDAATAIIYSAIFLLHLIRRCSRQHIFKERYNFIFVYYQEGCMLSVYILMLLQAGLDAWIKPQSV